jgi:hypothetical protein
LRRKNTNAPDFVKPFPEIRAIGSQISARGSLSAPKRESSSREEISSPRCVKRVGAKASMRVFKWAPENFSGVVEIDVR